MTVSVASDVLDAVDAYCRAAGGVSRSEVVENALRDLLDARRRADLAAELDAYYGNRQKDEIAEEESMVRAFRRSRRRLDLDADPRK